MNLTVSGRNENKKNLQHGHRRLIENEHKRALWKEWRKNLEIISILMRNRIGFLSMMMCIFSFFCSSNLETLSFLYTYLWTRIKGKNGELLFSGIKCSTGKHIKESRESFSHTTSTTTKYKRPKKYENIKQHLSFCSHSFSSL